MAEIEGSSRRSTPFGKRYPFGLRTIMELFDVGPGVAITALVASALIVLGAGAYFVKSAPPKSITITSGPVGSVFHRNALRYAAILERDGVKAKVLTSEGSAENLARLADRNAHVDLAIAQGGIPTPAADRLVSLGGISYQPILVFYRGAPLELLSGLAGKKVAIGPVGSGARTLAIALLAANGIKEGGSTALLDWEADAATAALKDGRIDAAFIMSENASSDILHGLLRSEDIHLFNFKQAGAYSRKIEHLNVLTLPEGSIDFGLDLPPHDVSLIGPMVELVATKELHPALIDLIIEAAKEVHGRPGVLQHKGEFPTPVEHAIPLSEEAVRFYKSGKTYLYLLLPFWLASLATRIVVVILPVALLLFPTLKTVPAFFRWKTATKIRRRYRELQALEEKLLAEADPAKKEALTRELDRLSEIINGMSVPASFADQLYQLRVNTDYVRQLVERKQAVVGMR